MTRLDVILHRMKGRACSDFTREQLLPEGTDLEELFRELRAHDVMVRAFRGSFRLKWDARTLGLKAGLARVPLEANPFPAGASHDRWEHANKRARKCGPTILESGGSSQSAPRNPSSTL